MDVRREWIFLFGETGDLSSPILLARAIVGWGFRRKAENCYSAMIEILRSLETLGPGVERPLATC